MNEEKQEIIIVRRGSDGEDGHHGGAWKIAFADFMTAMMALFLVLWLVNAANEETKKAVASYFNPVKLVDRNKSSKGLSDPGGVSDLEQEGTRDKPYPEEVQIDTPADKPNALISDAVFFEDPEKALELILAAAAAEVEIASHDAGDKPVQQDSYVDPFAPENWHASKAQSGTNLNLEQQTGNLPPVAAVQGENVADEKRSEAAGAEVGKDEGSPADAVVAGAGQILDTEKVSALPSEENKPETAKVSDMPELVTVEKSKSEEIADQVSAALAAAGLPSESISVKAGNDRVIVSLMDGDRFEMFGVGSAVPNARAIAAMEALARPIKQAVGMITVVGHTDGRPYQAGAYDNWKLSADRALAAFYMLRRAGLEEKGIRSLSGMADRQLIVAEDPYDDRNRRIEILLEVSP